MDRAETATPRVPKFDAAANRISAARAGRILGRSPRVVVGLAMAHYAKSIGFKENPPER